jgi:hypothetical protein
MSDTLLGQTKDIVTRIDAAIQNKYKTNPDKLAAWKSASCVERTSRKARTSELPVPPTIKNLS